MRQEAEQQRSREMQQQQQNSQQQADQQWNDTLRQQQSRANADMAQAEAVRRTWQQRPPLAAEKNPLLGRWESLGSGQRKGGAPGLSPEMAKLANALIGGMTGGLCDSMLGRGTIEFRPAGLVAIGRDGREQPMYRAEYRGGGSRVVVLPQGGTTFTHMIIDFDGPDHATVAAVGCGLARAGGSAAKAAVANTAVAAADAGATLQWTLLGKLGRERRHGRLRRAGVDPQVGRPRADARPVRLQDAPGDRRQGLPLGAQRVRVRLRPVAPAHADDDRLFRARWARARSSTRAMAPCAWEPVGSSGPAYEHWQVACKRR